MHKAGEAENLGYESLTDVEEQGRKGLTPIQEWIHRKQTIPILSIYLHFCLEGLNGSSRTTYVAAS